MSHSILPLAALLLLAGGSFGATSTSFVDFDRRAKAGEHLNVIFFGASLTWGANATDQQWTSYRANVARLMEAEYPDAHLKFRDGAIGGTGSQLGVFRVNRDVLRHKPDLVFLDFSANDDIYSDTPETLASYEGILRRLITEAHCPVVQVIFPFKWNVADANLEKMKRRDAHLALSKAYHTAVGDAIALGIDRVKAGALTVEKIWPYDGAHPGDEGYKMFADAAWSAFQHGVKDNLVCAAPEKMLYADTYMKQARVRISTLGELPAGWRVGAPNLTAAWYDMLMSRWLDDEVIVSNRLEVKGPDGKKTQQPQEVARLKVQFRGATVMVFGEGTTKTCKFRAFIDGKLVERMPPKATEPVKEFDAGGLATAAQGNAHLVQTIAEGLDTTVEHTLEIEPIFTADKWQELRLESICVAGGEASVRFDSTKAN